MIRGERFNLDLDSDDEIEARLPDPPSASLFVKDVLERQPASPTPPSAPKLKSKNGFPDHQKREIRSRFRQQQSSPIIAEPFPPSAGIPHPSVQGSKQKSWEQKEKERIDQENRQKLAQMSPEEIENERRELMNSFSPGLLQRLLQRPHLESGSAEADLSSPIHDIPASKPTKSAKSEAKGVRFEEPSTDTPRPNQSHDDQEHPHVDALPPIDVHFPEPDQPPDLDPSSESFFDDLHQKYFPSLPLEPDKLEWMQPPSSSKAAYNPSANAFSAGEIRFSFKGDLIPPKVAAEIPVTEGLHHHGDAPDSAGYTISELAHLARSTYPTQRCIAFQTLGRILHRLSKGEFGDPGEPGQGMPGAQDTFGELARGLWREVARTHVIETLTVESEGNGVDGGRHVSAKAYATEALWLWQRGGGRRWKAG